MPENNKQKEFLDQLLKPCATAPEHEVLLRLQGVWQMSGAWYYIPGKARAAIRGVMTNTAILGGLYLESRVVFQSWEGSRVIYAYDSQEGRYVAFAFSAVNAHFDIEYGGFDAAADTLTFGGTETVGNNREEIRFQRKLTFVDDNTVEMEISYPDFAPERRLGMAIHLARADTAAQ